MSLLVLPLLVLLLAVAFHAFLGVALVFSSPDSLVVKVRWGFFSLRVYPRGGKKEDESKKKKRKARVRSKERGVAPGEKKAWDLPRARALLSSLTAVLRYILRNVRVNWLTLHLDLAGGADAAAAAILYGRLQALLGAATPVLARIRRRDIALGLRYDIQKPNVFLNVCVSIRAYVIVAAAVRAAWDYSLWRRGGQERRHSKGAAPERV